jgi:hypothetical protein
MKVRSWLLYSVAYFYMPVLIGFNLLLDFIAPALICAGSGEPDTPCAYYWSMVMTNRIAVFTWASSALFVFYHALLGNITRFFWLPTLLQFLAIIAIGIVLYNIQSTI